jgi:low affinity Fe/Cu permease
MRETFNKAADVLTNALGSPVAMFAAAAIIVVWALAGPVFQFSDTWQPAINTGTTIVTFLMVFVIQNTQNRNSKAMHAKLDEVISALSGARNELIDAEEEPEAALDAQLHELRELSRRAAAATDAALQSRGRTRTPATGSAGGETTTPSDR